MISAILACTPQGGIGYRGTLPWPSNASDMAWFRKHTENHIVVMGRRTWDDPKMPKPLPHRINCVFTHGDLGSLKVRRLEGAVCEQLQELQQQFADRHIFVIGGKHLYEAALPVCEQVLLTRMRNNYVCDVRINLAEYLQDFRLRSVLPDTNLNFEIWQRCVH
jgi:dihydrofolate reductase